MTRDDRTRNVDFVYCAAAANGLSSRELGSLTDRYGAVECDFRDTLIKVQKCSWRVLFGCGDVNMGVISVLVV